MDWVSFGYGAGALATAWSAWDARDEVVARLWLFRQRVRVWRVERRMLYLAGLRRIRELERDAAALRATAKALTDTLEVQTEQIRRMEDEHEKLALAHKQLVAADKKWAAYKGLSTDGRVKEVVAAYTAAVTPAKKGVPVGPGAASKGTVTVHLGAKKGGNFWVRPGAAKAPRQPQRLDGLGYAGKPGTVCGRGMCCLGASHDGDCTV